MMHRSAARAMSDCNCNPDPGRPARPDPPNSIQARLMLSRTLSSFHFHSPSTTSSAQSSDNEDDSDEGQNGGGSSSSKRRSRGLFRAFSRKSRRRKPSPYAGRDGGTGSERGSSTERESQKAASENGSEPSSSLNRSGSNNSSLYGGPAASTSSFNNASSSSVELHEHAPSHPSDNESSSDSDENQSQRNDDEEEEESDDPWENDYRDDPEVRANTSANSGTGKRAAEYLESEIPALAVLDMEPIDGPNLVKSPSTSSTSPFGHHHLTAGNSNTSLHDLDEKDNHHRSAGLHPSRPHSRRLTSQTGSINSVNSKDEYPLVSSRPLHERNRCTITLTHGDPDGFIKGTTPSNANRKPRKQKKTYVVASDLSEESYYAIEWAIGTVLRNGDELLFVTVMETDSKLDPDDTRHYDKTQKIRNQHERQTRVLQLSREATALIERTHLHIRVLCQAIHAKNARHMLVDLIDYFHPTLVIVGSRGLGKLKGIILGSVSHYLIQKSSSPVMVTRRRLKPPQKPRRTYDLQREPRVDSLADAAIDKESHTGVVQSSDEETDGAPSTSAKKVESGVSSAATTGANTPTTPASAASTTDPIKPVSDTESTAKAQNTDAQPSQNTKDAGVTKVQESAMHVKEPAKPALSHRTNSEDIVQVRADSGDIEDIEEEDDDDDKPREEGRVDRHNVDDDSDDDDELPSTELQSPPVDLDSKGRVVEDAVTVDKAEEAERQVQAASKELEARKDG